MVFSCRRGRGGCTVLVVLGKEGVNGVKPPLLFKGVDWAWFWARNKKEGWAFGYVWTRLGFGFIIKTKGPVVFSSKQGPILQLFQT